MGEKEKDTEAKITKREHQGEPTTGEPNVMTDKPANRRKTKLGRNKESKENNLWRMRKQHITSKRGNRKSGTGTGESNHSERKGSRV